ncbi:RNA polymerase sigma factor [Cellvibrio sp. KY-YJ-3]|jgi:RNA polymerase sigma-70 factor (ECF subfamily)|uniref:RNA polymerase sigma factor n=1 Tax=Cellvibrio sp. KY-YJ-3 TaxID=454662 RepID=UPI00124499CC|nr:sigma-70 family RNA polymerase sigma factor [Cellvibrio sp. KY-YJ-3]QEY10830.1 sigma-70 family RNA polymerase sigma factor [Cellvibrio sp. KY-YJ-3]
MSLSDQELIARVVSRRDQHAFAQLVLRYQSALRIWARRLCNGDTHLADDLAQETFMKAYAALGAFRAEAKFSTWLYRIAFNIAANRWRAKKIEWCELDGNEEIEAEQCSVKQFHAQRDVEAAMQTLSAGQQLALRLCYEDGFSHEEAASIMGIPLGTVKTHIARGKAKLQTLLASWQDALPH